jgi:hypothetical protein
MAKYEYNLGPSIKTRIFSSEGDESLNQLLKRIRLWVKTHFADDEDCWLNFMDLYIDNDSEGNLTARVRFVEVD